MNTALRRPPEDAPCKGNETPWFEGYIHPARLGIYQRRIRLQGREWLWSRWDGRLWYKGEPTAEDAEASQHISVWQHLPWRGCSEPPV